MTLAISHDFSERARLAEFPDLMDQPCRSEEMRVTAVDRRGPADVGIVSEAPLAEPRLPHAAPSQSKPIQIVDVGVNDKGHYHA